MMTSITIKNIPEELYERLRIKATLHHRSINSEMIHCLESVLMPKRLTINERLQRAKWIRSKINIDHIDPDEISQAISEGRP
ncbi:MAG: Arc family DNA-binding protein [Desulfobacteraceae bacterium]|nr:MAG: Arc family DNA-binding protein [Desulfobacteraceae bacterium]